MNLDWSLIGPVVTFVLGIVLTGLGMRSKFQKALAKLSALSSLIGSAANLLGELSEAMKKMEEALRDETVTEDECREVFTSLKEVYLQYERLQRDIQTLINDP